MRTEDQRATMKFGWLDDDMKKGRSNRFSLFGLDNTEMCMYRSYVSGRPSAE